jgi:hypothetical protein
MTLQRLGDNRLVAPVFGTYVRISRAQRNRIVLACANCRGATAKATAMLLIPWRLARAARATAREAA